MPERVVVTSPDGLPLSVRVAGRGPALVLLHGFTGSAEAWGEHLLSALSRHGRVIAPDLIGHGASARPHDPDRYRLERVLADLAAVQNALADGPATWIGYSMGGRVALAGAALGAAPLRALVLESASPGLADAEDRAARRRADDARAGALESGGIEPFVDAWMEQPLFASQRELPAPVRAAERQRRTAQDPLALAACLRGLGTGSQPSFWSRLTDIAIPTLLLTGERDLRFTEIAGRMSETLKDGRRARIENAGHAVHLERPGAWIAAVAAFLDEVVGDPR